MKITIKVPDMTCNHCKMTIESALQNVDEVETAHVDLDRKTVEVNGKADVQEVVTAINNAGYTAEEILNIQ